jgi:non-ribosomal peptide synthetase component F
VRDRAAHEFVALTDVLKWSGVPRGEQLFESLFVHESIPDIGSSNGPLRLKDMEIIGPSSYRLALVATPSDGLRLDAYYDPSRYSHDLIDAILSDYTDMLAAALEMPSQGVGSLLSDRHADTPGAPDVGPRNYPTVVGAFETAAVKNPEAPAVSDDTETLTYGDLRARARRISAELLAAGIGPGDIVPVAIERSVSSVAAFLGVMGAGAAFLPLDLEYPSERLRQILEVTEPRVIVTKTSAGKGLT